jgi:hypothetical protein
MYNAYYQNSSRLPLSTRVFDVVSEMSTRQQKLDWSFKETPGNPDPIPIFSNFFMFAFTPASWLWMTFEQCLIFPLGIR